MRYKLQLEEARGKCWFMSVLYYILQLSKRPCFKTISRELLWSGRKKELELELDRKEEEEKKISLKRNKPGYFRLEERKKKNILAPGINVKSIRDSQEKQTSLKTIYSSLNHKGLLK